MSVRDSYSTKGALCPHCDYLNDPSNDNYSLYSEDTCEWECGLCGEEFTVSVYVSYAWTTEPKDPDDD